MPDIKTFDGNGLVHTGSSGFRNYVVGSLYEGGREVKGPNPRTRFETALADARREFPGCVVINGNDDWSAARQTRPETFCRLLNVDVLAYFHTGISGVTKSGVVLSPAQFETLRINYRREFGVEIESTSALRIEKQ